MAEKARNLRKFLSKSKLEKEKKAQEEKEKQEKNQGFDPLRMSMPNPIQKPPENEKKEDVDPLRFFDIVSLAMEKKKEKEREDQLKALKELNQLGSTQPPVNLRHTMAVNRTGQNQRNDLLSKVKKDNPTKLLNLISGKMQEKIKQYEEKEEEEPPKEDPFKNVPGKLGPRELKDSEKQKLMMRLSSARQSLLRNKANKGIEKHTSEAVINKARSIEQKMGGGIGGFMLKDNDVQHVEEKGMTEEEEKLAKKKRDVLSDILSKHMKK